MSHNFQVDLRSIIQLLSNNLYSGPQVFVRELIQNAVDAIRARHSNPRLDGKIDMELVTTPEGGRILMVEDNGIGLTEAEMHLFLATIGGSSKRDQLSEARTDYIGQFGIGLLSSFIVTDEIVLLTRSAKENSPAIEWRGKSDGSYSMRHVESNLAVGTKIFLRMAAGREEYFVFEHLLAWTKNYASLLEIPITLQENESRVSVNSTPPWRQTFSNEMERRAGFAQFAAEMFELDCFDFIPLEDPDAGFSGVAYILPYTANPLLKNQHRLYLKDMLISEAADTIAPEWAFFVRGIVNGRKLAPTASRESVCEDEALIAVRESIGRQLRQYIQSLAKHDSERLRHFLSLHSLAIKHLSTFDDEFLEMFIDHLPFETNFGTHTLTESREQSDELFYVTNVDEFRQIAEIAAAQGVHVINAGYVYESEILSRYAALSPEKSLRQISLTSFAQRLREVGDEEQEVFGDFLAKAEIILQRFGVVPTVRHFMPANLAAIFVASRGSFLRRTADEVRKDAAPEWEEVFDNIFDDDIEELPELCLNASNPLTRQLALKAGKQSPADLKPIVEVLYAQSLLFSRRSLRPEELAALNDGIMHLAEIKLGGL